MIIFEWLNLWQVNVVLHLIFAVIFNQYYKLAIKDNIRDGASTVLLQIICALSFLFLAPFFPFKFSTDYKVYLLLLLALFFYTINDRTQTTARKGLPVSEYLIIKQLSKIFLIISGIFIFHEPAIPLKIFGAILILSGNFVLLYKKGKFVFNKYVWWAVLGTLTLAIGMTIDIGLISQFNMPVYLIVSMLIPAILIIIFEKISLSDISSEFNSGKRKEYVFTGIAWCGAIFFMYRAFILGEVVLVVPLTALSVLLNVLVAYFFLNEKENLIKNIFVSILIAIGVYFTVS